MFVKAFIVAMLLPLALAIPRTLCPAWMAASGHLSDLALLTEAVSWDTKDVEGVCGTYKMMYEKVGRYDTKMRIYQSIGSANEAFVVFRPTQSTTNGQNIHNERKLTHCTFLPNCSNNGMVHNRFQQAFLSLVSDLPSNLLNVSDIFIGGHSLGGSLQLFFSLYVMHVFHIVPTISLGLAGPFIGDALFAWNYYSILRNATLGTWWQVETIDTGNWSSHDDIVETYQIDDNLLFIDYDSFCAFPIKPLPVPQDSYGMHDLNQYRLFVKGQDCSF